MCVLCVIIKPGSLTPLLPHSYSLCWNLLPIPPQLFFKHLLLSIVTIPCCRSLERIPHSTVFCLLFLSLGKKYIANICLARVFIAKVEMKMFHDSLLVPLAIALLSSSHMVGLKLYFCFVYFTILPHRDTHGHINMHIHVHNNLHVLSLPLPFPNK